jgi:Trk K+ transport system NAD-binding subunit
VGQYLIEEVLKEGMRLVITDIDEKKVKKVQEKHKSVEAVGPGEIYSVGCDI